MGQISESTATNLAQFLAAFNDAVKHFDVTIVHAMSIEIGGCYMDVRWDEGYGEYVADVP